MGVGARSVDALDGPADVEAWSAASKKDDEGFMFSATSHTLLMKWRDEVGASSCPISVLLNDIEDCTLFGSFGSLGNGHQKK